MTTTLGKHMFSCNVVDVLRRSVHVLVGIS